MSGQYPQWNTRPYGGQSSISGQQPVPHSGTHGPNMMSAPNFVNGPVNAVTGNPSIPRHPQPSSVAPPIGTIATGMVGPSNQHMYRSSSAQMPPPPVLGQNTTPVNTGGHSVVNGYKGSTNQVSSNPLVSQPLSNGPPGPGMSVVGPKGQVLGKSFLSPAGTGPIDAIPLGNYTQQLQTAGAAGSQGQPVSSVGPRYSSPPMPGFVPGHPPSSVSSNPLMPRVPPPINQRPLGPPGPLSRPSGPPPPGTTQFASSPPTGALPVTSKPGSAVMGQPGPPAPPLGGIPPVLQNEAHTPGPEPASRKSSRAPSPVPSQKYDALEGQFTPSSPPTQPFPGVQQPQPTSLPGVEASSTPADATPSPSITSGKRVYPQMAPNSYTTPHGSNVPLPPPSQPGVPSPSGVPGVAMQQPHPVPGMHAPPLPGQPAGAPPLGPGHPPSMGSGPPPTGVTPFTSSGTPIAPGSSRPSYPLSTGTPTMANSGPHAPNTSMGNVVNSFGQMNLQPDATRPLNLLQEKNLIPPEGIESVKPNLPSDYKKVNVNTDVFRCTLNAIPNTQSLLNKCRLPLGLLIHPFKDLSQLPVIQSSVIVRCRSCRTYINPFVSFMDMRRWKCNLCYRVNELPEEFSYDPVSKTYGDPQRRPEIKSSTIEFIAPSEYMLRPPQPAVYLYVLDVSFNALNTGYLPLFCQTLLEELDRIPGDSRTQVGFITFDSCLQFYNLQEGLSQPQMLVVSDVEDVFLPLPEGLLVNIHESRELVNDLLNSLPSMFEGNMETGSALGPALQTAHKLLSATGGRVSVFQTQLPTVGPGALKNREDPNERTGKKVQHLGPAIDFYKKLALDCSAQQVAVDMFLLNGQYVDLATIAGVSKYSGGSLYYFPNFHTKSNPGLTERFEGTLRRYITRKIGFESVMRIRCSRGLTIHTFHGNFFVRSTDLLSLPNINPDSGFGMQMSIEDNIESNFSCFQAALLYTSSKGERRIRVHTLCIPVTNSITEVFGAADQQAIVGLLAKMAVDKSTSQSMGDARDALVNSCIDMLGAFGTTVASPQKIGQLPCPYTLRLMPAFVLALLKYSGFRTGIPTRIDDRVFALESAKSLPLSQFLLEVYPSLYPVHKLDDQQALNKGDSVIPQPPVLQLSSGNMDRHGVYLMDRGSAIYLWVGAAVNDTFCQDVFDVPNFTAIQDGMTELPELDNATSERLRTFVNYLNDQRPFPAAFLVIRDDSRSRGLFLQHMIEDRSDSAFSYYEFLQHLQKEVK